MERDEQIRQATELYVAVVSLIDPIRFRAWSDLGLTMPTLKVIFLLRDAPGAPSGLLASRLGVTPSTITGLVDRLVNQGLVRRDEDARDRRLVRNFITEAGMRAVSDIEQHGTALLHGIMNELSPEQLDRLITALRELTDAAERARTATLASA